MAQKRVVSRVNVVSGSAQRLASDRWQILRKAVLSSSKCKEGGEEQRQGAHVTASSVRSFSSFGLFTVTQHFPVKVNCFGKSKGFIGDSEQKLLVSNRDSSSLATEQWYHYTATVDRSSILNAVYKCKTDDPTISVDVVVKYVSEETSLKTLTGFNNTGNVCVWPSEEVMAYYCLKHLEMFCGSNICELGGGMTSLSGLVLASTHLPSKVLLTDGNQKSVDNVKEIISANHSSVGVDVSAEVILWDQSFLAKPSVHDSSFDYILCADCLFFTEVHSELVQVIFKLLNCGGEALIFAPRRSGTLEQFCSIASEYFDLQTATRYDDIVWLKHEEALHKVGGHYKVDLHYPIMVLLKKMIK